MSLGPKKPWLAEADDRKKVPPPAILALALALARMMAREDHAREEAERQKA